MTRARLSQASIKKGAVALAAVFLALTLGFVVYNHQRGERYAEAVRLAEAGDASGAYAIFVGLGGYADAAQRGAGLVEKDPAVPYRRAAKGGRNRLRFLRAGRERGERTRADSVDRARAFR